MFFIIQLKDHPNEIFMVRATSRIDAFNLARIIDVPKRVWDLENFDTSAVRPACQKVKIG